MILKQILKDLDYPEIESTIVFTNNSEIREYNEAFRKKDKATDVLSFPMGDEDYLGDIMISVEKAEIQSYQYGCSLQEELVRLIIHGFLHLLGFDHVGVKKNEATKMRRLELKYMEMCKREWPNWL